MKIERIAKLLNKAEHAATPHEANLYFEKAQALATAHSISLAKARLHQGPQRPAQPVNRTIRVGEARRHANRHLVRLLAVIADVNGLKVDVAHNSTYVIAFGFADEIDTTEVLWGRIASQMVRFGEEYLALGEWRKDVRAVPRRGRYVTAPMTRQTARATYYESFISTIHERLTQARTDAVREAEVEERNDHGDDRPGTAVALRQRDVAVTDFYRSQSTARGTWRGQSSVVGLSESARNAGARDARTIRLSEDRALRGAPAALP